ncbi:MAG: hypothetical protein GY765_10160 [bacterium]|nr:hypothetical protein [bacterium]
MKRAGWNPTKRNRKIGTEDQGFSPNNKLVIPWRWSDSRAFYEQLNNPVANTVNIQNHPITFLVEAPRKGHMHACTIDDVVTVLNLFPERDIQQISLIAFRQPKRKEELISSVWGRYVFHTKISNHPGPAIHLDAQKINAKLKWPNSLGPDGLKEIQRIEKDGHKITKDKRHFYIHTTPDTTRNTQLYRTLPHEVGHAMDLLLNSFIPADDADSEADAESIINAYDSKPSKDKEAFAHRYAEQFREKWLEEKKIPFDRIVDIDSMTKMNLKPEWFSPENLNILK